MSEEYIKKSELFDKTVRKNSIWNEVTNAEGKGLEEIANSLPTYSIPDTAKPEEGAELIDRRQIKWYGCDHEGHIKGINCETADCSKCFHATVEHDEVMSLPVYRIPDSADIEKIRAEIEEYRNILIPPKTSLKNLLEVQSVLNKVLDIIDKHIGGKDK